MVWCPESVGSRGGSWHQERTVRPVPPARSFSPYPGGRSIAPRHGLGLLDLLQPVLSAGQRDPSAVWSVPAPQPPLALSFQTEDFVRRCRGRLLLTRKDVSERRELEIDVPLLDRRGQGRLMSTVCIAPLCRKCRHRPRAQPPLSPPIQGEDSFVDDAVLRFSGGIWTLPNIGTLP
jgi:hypothetical protein